MSLPRKSQKQWRSHDKQNVSRLSGRAEVPALQVVHHFTDSMDFTVNWTSPPKQQLPQDKVWRRRKDREEGKWQDSEEMGLSLQWMKAHVHEFVCEVGAHSDNSNFCRVLAVTTSMSLAVGSSPLKTYEAFFKGFLLSSWTQHPQEHPFLPTCVK